jgi:hypothetical protein
MVESCCFFVLRPRVMMRAFAVRSTNALFHLLLSACGVNFYTFMAHEKNTHSLRLFHFFSAGPQIYCTIKVYMKCRSVSVLAVCKNVRQHRVDRNRTQCSDMKFFTSSNVMISKIGWFIFRQPIMSIFGP